MAKRGELTEKELLSRARYQAERVKEAAGTSQAVCELADVIVRGMRAKKALKALELLKAVNDERKSAVARSQSIRADMLDNDCNQRGCGL